MDTKPTHTPEPWHDKEGRLIGSDGNVIARLMAPDTIFSSVKRADVDRIVACVNAMAGIADPEGAIKVARSALARLLADKYLADPINNDRMSPVREALAALGGTQ
jgi:hypothetical protein